MPVIEIIPAIIPQSLQDLRSKLSLTRGLAKKVQIDVLDGRFTPFLSWPYSDGMNDFEKIISEEEGLPFWQDFSFEIDMMVSSPLDKFADWIAAGADALIVHFESMDGDTDFSVIKKECTAQNVSLGLALKPKTAPEAAFRLLLKADFAQLMGNDEIGRQGMPLLPTVYEKARKLRKEFPNLPIAVDIGVNFKTAPLLLAAGVNKFVSGSAIFYGDVRENMKNFEEIIYDDSRR